MRGAIKDRNPLNSFSWLMISGAGGLVLALIPVLTKQGYFERLAAFVIGAVLTYLLGFIPQINKFIVARQAVRDLNRRVGSLGQILEIRNELLGVKRSHLKINEFVDRDCQNELENVLEEGEAVLIRGKSMSGKTRLAVEVLKNKYPMHYIWRPETPKMIDEFLVSGHKLRKKVVIFLDDIDQLLTNDNLTLSELSTWLQADRIVVATISTRSFQKLYDDTSRGLVYAKILNSFNCQNVLGKHSEDEISRIKVSSYKDYADQAETFGLPAFLGGAHLAIEKFNAAEEGNFLGWAIIRSAIHWNQTVSMPISRQLLKKLTYSYPNIPEDDISFENALKWAIQPLNHSISLLIPQSGDQYVPLKLLSENFSEVIPDEVFKVITEQTLSSFQKTSLGNVMSNQGASGGFADLARVFVDALESGSGASKLDAATSLGRAISKDAALIPHALARLEELIERNPHDADAYSIIGFVYQSAYRREDAKVSYERALKEDEDNLHAWRNYPPFMRNNFANHPGLGDLYERSFKKHPDDFVIQNNYAFYLKNIANNMSAARDLYRSALNLRPYDIDLLNNYACFLTSVEEYQNFPEAKRNFEVALQIDPSRANTLANYARLLFAMKEDTQAIEYVNRALSLLNPATGKVLAAECHFYLMAHSATHFSSSAVALQELLMAKISTKPWSFEVNLVRLEHDGSRNLSLMRAVALALNEGKIDRVSGLQDWKRAVVGR